RRIAGTTVSDYWRKTFAEPLGLDLWIGLPEKENARVATMYAPKVGKEPEPKQFYRDVATRGTFAHKVFTSPYGLNAVSEMNKPEIRAKPIVSLGGIGSANSLAKFYAMLANGGVWPATAGPSGGGKDRPAFAELRRDKQFFSTNTISWMTTTLTNGIDRVFQIPTAFSAGFMKDSEQATRRIFGRSTLSFGHPGAGGGHAFADPQNKISFAYLMNQ